MIRTDVSIVVDVMDELADLLTTIRGTEYCPYCVGESDAQLPDGRHNAGCEVDQLATQLYDLVLRRP